MSTSRDMTEGGDPKREEVPTPQVTAPSGQSVPPGDHAGPLRVRLTRGASVGRYVVLEQVGAGGMGVVYRAYDPKLQREVALKLLQVERHRDQTTTDAEARLLREAQAMAHVSHPNVLPVYDVGSLGDELFIAMEFVDGQTMRQWSKQHRRSWRDIVALMLQAGRGLAAAHDAALVHRDFKPGNVLVGTDGRVRVMDFGLARVGAEPDGEDRSNSGVDSGRRKAEIDSLVTPMTPLTELGAIVGTPAYMAPEQHLGTGVNAHSDQYAFCVTMYEALYGERPFRADSIKNLTEKKIRGILPDPPPGAEVPGWLRRLVVRGLSPHAAARYPSMPVLLADLDRDPRQRRRLFLAVGAVVAAVTATGFGVVMTRTETPVPVCTGAEAKIGKVWGDARKQALQQAFFATEVAFAERTWTRVEQSIDVWATAWSGMYLDACEATNVRREQSEDLLDLRMACLEDGLRQVDALVQVLSAADAKVVERAVGAASSLPELTQCSDIKGLLAAVPPPSDEQTRRAVDGLRAELARVNALGQAGKYAEALDSATAAEARARTLGYGPVHADAMYLLGVMRQGVGDYPGAEQAEVEAFFLARRYDHDEIAAASARRLVHLVGDLLERYDEAFAWGRHARIELERQGRTGALAEARLLGSLGNVLHSKGDLQAAVKHHRDALAILETLPEPRPLDVARTTGDLGMVLGALGEADEALGHLRRGLELRQTVLGPDHPSVGKSMINLGNALKRRGRMDEAIETLRQGLDALQRGLGSEHPDVGKSMANVASVLQKQGQYAEALKLYRRALEILTDAYGAEHGAVAGVHINIGISLQLQGDFDGALESLGRALEILKQAVGERHPYVASCYVNLGEALLGKGDYPAAIEAYEAGLEQLRATKGKRNVEVAEAESGLAQAYLGTGNLAKAKPLLEAALYVQNEERALPVSRAQTSFALARTLWDDPSGNDRARALLVEAEELVADTGPLGERTRTAIARWQRTHKLE